ncbi:B9 domain-containing protein 1 [Halotydeus destructor]|nr:B9 domain-containing protein 1 [Halotydeus destructor]
MDADIIRTSSESSENPELAAIKHSSTFSVSAVGQLISCDLPHHERAYCKFSFNHGPDWSIISGLDQGVTQVSKQSQVDGQFNRLIVWNFPIDVTFRSSNVHGWPQIVLSTFSYDMFGNDIPSGYGSTHIPPVPGRHEVRIPLFVPKSSSLVNQINAFFSGRRPEFVDPNIVAQAEGRELINVQSQGMATIQLNIALKDFHNQRYKSN